MIHRFTNFVFRCVAAAVAVLAVVLAADAQEITNPIADPIAKGNIRIELQLIAEGLNSPLWLVDCGDGTDRLFVVDQAGQIRLIRNGKLQPKPFLDVSDRLVKLKPAFDERGLLGLAFHPGFNDPNSPGFRKLYTYTSEPVREGEPADFTVVNQIDLGPGIPPEVLPMDHQAVISEWQVSAGNADMVDPKTRREVLRIDEPQFNHDGGAIAFGPDGMLYIGLGDGGAANDTAPGHGEIGNGQNTNTVLGSILRIDPLGRTGTTRPHGRYSIPPDNPFVNGGGVPEIWAYGLRNPFRMSFDVETGRLITGDIGQEHIEEINIIERGGNYGWRIMEGTFYFVPDAPKGQNIRTSPPPGVQHAPNLIPPVAMYDHDDGTSIIGGFVYRGSAIPELRGLYVFGEWTDPAPGVKAAQADPNGRLLYANLEKGQIFELILGADDRVLGQMVTGMGQDGRRELYVLTNDKRGPLGDGGKVYKIVPLK